MKKLITALMICLAIVVVFAGCTQAPAPAPTVTVTSTASAPAPAPTHEIVSVPTLSSPFGTGTYVMSTAFEDIAKKNHPWLRLPAVESSGFTYNVKATAGNPDMWKKYAIGTNVVMLYLAKTGTKPFFEERILGYRMLFQYAVCGGWFTTLDPNIKTPQDLVGKRIGLGTTGQLTWGTLATVALRDGYGILDQVDARYIGHMAAAQALLDGTVDAVFSSLYTNPMTGKYAKSGDMVLIESSGRSLYHIAFTDEQLANVQAKNPPMAPMSIKAGSEAGLNQDIKAIWSGALGYGVKDIFPEDLAYEYTKLFIDNADLLGEYHAMGTLAAAESGAYGLTKTLMHPGAVRAFEEIGVNIPD
ncbi:TAXI family TRAP transporter solute-binding subunit [Chloroflexota bacterium]